MHRGNGKPRVHARDHEHGGADPSLIVYEDVGDTGDGGGGGGIQFDTTPQAGGFLQVTTSSYMNLETEGSNNLNIDANGTGDVNLYSAAANINVTGGSGIVMDADGDNGIVLDTHGDGDLVLHASGGTSSIRLRAFEDAGHHIFLEGLPTTDPGLTGAIWNDSGTLKIS